MKAAPVVAIDGPGGAGKGTICHALATQNNWHLLDSGAIYRLLALAAIKRGVSLEDEAGLIDLARKVDVKMRPKADGSTEILLSGEPVGAALREESCGEAASRLAVLPGVRKALLALQRRFRRDPGLIADGRDMGTVVFPDAGLKIFLTASAEERAVRRHKQLKEQGLSASIPALLQAIRERDRRDTERTVNPLRPAEDAVVIDTTELSVAQVIDQVMKLMVTRYPGLGDC